nr:uncharacterized protein LOC118878851 isoform X2 [Drosophila suzukii]
MKERMLECCHLRLGSDTPHRSLAVYNPSRDFYWHKTFHHSLLANGTHKTPSKETKKVNLLRTI